MNEAYGGVLSDTRRAWRDGIRTSNAIWTCGTDVSDASRTRGEDDGEEHMPERTSCWIIRDEFVILSTVLDPSSDARSWVSHKDWPAVGHV